MAAFADSGLGKPLALNASPGLASNSTTRSCTAGYLAAQLCSTPSKVVVADWGKPPKALATLTAPSCARP